MFTVAKFRLLVSITWDSGCAWQVEGWGESRRAGGLDLWMGRMSGFHPQIWEGSGLYGFGVYRGQAGLLTLGSPSGPCLRCLLS